MLKYTIFSVFAVLSFSYSTFLYGSVTDYISKYRIGVDLINSSDDVTVHYDRDRESTLPKYCTQKTDDPTKMTCSVGLSAGRGNGFLSQYLHGFGLFFQQPFKRQGFFYFNYDLGFALKMLRGDFLSNNDELYSPLKNVSFQMYGGVAYPYIQFGITPQSTWPDLLLSIGPMAQFYIGQVTINDETKNVALAQGSKISKGLSWLQAFVEIEIVFWRFGDGYFSYFWNHSLSSSNVEAGNFYPKEKDGMSKFGADFYSSVQGFKLLFNFP